MKTTKLNRRDSFPAVSDNFVSVPLEIATGIRNRILRGELKPGQRITESRLSKEFGVGQPTVREALLALESAGLVQRISKVGTFVTKLDLDDVGNLYQIRHELEGLAAALAAEKRTDADLEELRHLVDRMKTEGENIAFPGNLEIDFAFHRRIWQIAGNRQLAEILETVVIPLVTLTFIHLGMDRVQEATGPRAAEIHSKIVEGIASGFPDLARKTMEEHIRTFLNLYVSRLLTGK